MNKHSLKWLVLIIVIASLSLLAITKLASRSTSVGSLPEVNLAFYNPIGRKVEVYDQFANKLRDIAIIPEVTGDVVSAKYFSNINKIAFLTSETQPDRIVTKLNLYDIASGQTEVLDEESPKLEEYNVAFQARIISISFLSPDDRYLVYQIGGWEYCGDRIINLETKQKVSTEVCNSLRFSPSGKEFVSFSTPGLSSGADFSFAKVDDIFSSGETYVNSLFSQVDWSKVKGDVESLKHGQSEFFGIDQAEYTSENELYIIQGRTGFGFNLYKFDKNAMTLELLKQNIDDNSNDYNHNNYVNNLDLVNGIISSNLDSETGKFQVMTLPDYKVKEYNLGVKKGYVSEYFNIFNMNRNFAMVVQGIYTEGYSVNQKAGVYLFDFRKEKLTKLESLGKSLLFMNKL